MITLLIVLAIGLFIWLFIWWLIFNSPTSSDRPHCFLSFHRFKTLYNLNEDRYCYTCHDYSDFAHLYILTNILSEIIYVRKFKLNSILSVFYSSLSGICLVISKRREAREIMVLNWC